MPPAPSPALVGAPVVLQRPHGGDEDDGAGGDPAGPADDVEELLHPHVGAESRLGDHVVAQLQPEQVGDQRGVAVGDVGEGTGVHQAGLALQRLDQVRLDRVLEQDRHRPGGPEVLGRHRLAVAGVGGGDLAEPPPQVLEVAGDGEHGHHLRGRGDVEAGLARVAVGRPAEPERDLAQRPVVHVHGALPGDPQGVDVVRVAVQHRGVQQRRQQVVGGADRVDVAGEVEVEVLHRHHLGEAAAGGPALDPEHRPQRGLAQAEDGVAADIAHALGQRHRGRRLPLPRLGRGHPGDADELRVGPIGEALDRIQGDLRLEPPVGLDLLGLEAEPAPDPLDRLQLRFLCDLQAALHLLVLLSSTSVGDRRRPQLGDEAVAIEALERERLDQLGRASRSSTCSASVLPTIGAALNP